MVLQFDRYTVPLEEQSQNIKSLKIQNCLWAWMDRTAKTWNTWAAESAALVIQASQQLGLTSGVKG